MTGRGRRELDGAGGGDGGGSGPCRTPSFTGRALEQDKEVLDKFRLVAKDYGLSPKDVHLNVWDSECWDPARPPGPAPP